MNTVNVECPTCRLAGAVAAPSLLVDVPLPAADATQELASVHWICDACRDLVAVTVEGEVALRLVSAGALLVEVETDDLRPPHPELSAGGAPLTLDDLLDLHRDLDDGADRSTG